VTLTTHKYFLQDFFWFLVVKLACDSIMLLL